MACSKWWGWGDLNVTFPLDDKPDFFPFLHAQLQWKGRTHTFPLERAAIELPPSRLSDGLAAQLAAVLGAGGLRRDQETRLLHSYGKSYKDLIRIRQGDVRHPPDAVAFPECEHQVEALVDLAKLHDLVLVPFGGGTSVVGGVEAQDARPVVTVSLSRLDRLLALDKVAQTATFEAGILGPRLEEVLKREGFTLGHFPQSFEFSSLGGWVATRSAGQESGRYGKIDDMVVSLRAVTPQGRFESLTVPASAAGPDLNRVWIGSEGRFGIITSVTVRIHPLPRQTDIRGYYFRDWTSGVEAARRLLQSDLEPAIVRLSDPAETAAYGKLSHPATGLVKLFKRYVKWKAGSHGAMLLVGFEGDRPRADWRMAKPLLADGVCLGRSPGARWREGRFALPYLRDVLLDRALLVDTLETATEWSNLERLYQAVSTALKGAATRQGVHIYVMCHLSHAYHDGACLYFTLACPQLAGRELEQWQELKTAAGDAIMQHGGTISHHHGLGRDHAAWLSKEVGTVGLTTLHGLKQTLDPKNLLNPQVWQAP